MVTTHFQLRAINYFAVLLCILWSMSPWGGQAVLHVLSIGIQSQSETQPLFYLDTSAQGVKSVLGTASLTVFMSSFSAIFAASLISPMSVQLSPMDNWGNVKIPLLEYLDPETASDGWIPVPAQNISYSSVLGNPIAGIPFSGNVTFQITSSYFILDCQEPTLVRFDQEFHWHDTPFACSSSRGSWMLGGDRLINNIAQGTCSIGSLTNNTGGSNSTNSTRPILFQSMAPHGISGTNCSVRFSNVESRISCISANCSVTSMRLAPSSTFTPLDDCLIAKNFYNEFTKACGPYRTTFSGAGIVSEQIALASLAEGYIMTDASPAAAGQPIEAQVDLSTLTANEMSERVTRVLNTYWMASIAPEYIAGGMSGFNFSDLNVLKDHPGSLTNSTVVADNEIFICDYMYLTVLFVSSGLLVVACVLSIWFRRRVLAPDIFGQISSLVRDNMYFPNREARTGSVLDGYDMTKRLKDVNVVLADVCPGEGVGHVALVEMGTIEIGRLKKDRQFR
jgi:hypothetical protein